MNLNLVREIANGVVDWTWQLKKQCNPKGYNLRGFCAVASAELYRRLVDHGYKPKIGYSTNPDMDWNRHIFVLLDGFIIDTTAIQFDSRYDDVMILPEARSRKPWFWQREILFTSDVELHKFQNKEHWVDWQCANNHIQESYEM